ncbi:8636_t:CDS:1, partial [Racocetra fulgida]
IVNNTSAEPKLGRINLSLQARDKAIMACRRHRTSGTEIALKVVASYNNASEVDLQYVHKADKDLYTEKQLKRLIERDDCWLHEDAGSWTILDQLITTELKLQGK